MKKGRDYIVLLMIVLYLLVFGALSILKHLSFNSTAFDLAIYDQTTWSFSKFTNLFNTVMGAYPFGDHVTPILFLIAPFYWIYSSPIVLLILQTVVIALGALPLYWMARKELGTSLSKIILLSYFLYPSLQYINLFDFHPDTLLITFFMFAFYYMQKNNYKLFFLSIFLAGLCKEYIGLTITFLGIYVFFFKNKKIGAITTLLGLLWLFINFKLVIPFFNPKGYVYTVSVLGYLGNTLPEMIKTIITRPLFVISNIITLNKVLYLGLVFVPLAFSLLAPEILFLTIPGFAIVLIQQNITYSAILYQHNALIIPFVFIALIYGLKRFIKITRMKKKVLAVIIVSISTLAFVIYGPFTILYNKESFNINTAHVKTGHKVLAMIPKNASVSASTWVLPHLSQREFAYMFPNPFERYFWDFELSEENRFYGEVQPDYVLLDIMKLDPMMKAEDKEYYFNLVLDNEDYETLLSKDGWILLKRKI